MFDTSIKLDKLVRAVRLADQNATVTDGTECKVCGWGKMDNNEKARELRSVSVYKVDAAICKKDYDSTRVKFRITSSMMCAGVPEGHMDSCSGDSVSFRMPLSALF